MKWFTEEPSNRVIVFVAIALTFLFYWNEIRPIKIKSGCIDKTVVKMVNENGGLTEQEISAAKFLYELCKEKASVN